MSFRENIEQLIDEELEAQDIKIEDGSNQSDYMNTTNKVFFALPNMLDDDYIDTDEFQEGIKKAAGMAGMYTIFVNSGMADEDAVNLIRQTMNSELAVRLAEINKEAAEALSKIPVVY
jgi:hypothetical protein